MRRKKIYTKRDDIKRDLEIKNYRQSGANISSKAMIGLSSVINTIEEDIYEPRETLVARSRQLYMGNSLGCGAIKKLKTNVVGIGLKLKPTINSEILGITEEKARGYEKKLSALWSYWAESTECDFIRMNNFYQLQALAFASQLIDGDCFALLPFQKNNGEIFDLKIRLIESTRCIDPMGADEKHFKQGVEVNELGIPLAYHFRKEVDSEETIRIEAFGKITGRKNVIHLFEQERIGQMRGVPFLSPVIEELHQSTKIRRAELVSAAVSSIFTAFITNENNNTVGRGIERLQGETTKPEKDNVVKFEAGNITELQAGQDVKFAEPKKNGASFEMFMTNVAKNIGAALEIPHEVLLNSFNASYSASRASLNEVWKSYSRYRDNLVSDFCKPIYEEFVDYLVDNKMINLPGYDNKLKRRAYVNSVWIGSVQSQLDPLKEVKASVAKIEAGLSTKEIEAKILGGGDYEKIMKQRKVEVMHELELEKIKRESREKGEIE